MNLFVMDYLAKCTGMYYRDKDAWSLHRGALECFTVMIISLCANITAGILEQSSQLRSML